MPPRPIAHLALEKHRCPALLQGSHCQPQRQRSRQLAPRRTGDQRPPDHEACVALEAQLPHRPPSAPEPLEPQGAEGDTEGVTSARS